VVLKYQSENEQQYYLRSVQHAMQL